MLQNVSRFKYVRHLTPVPKCSKFVYGPKSDIVHNCYCVNWFFIISNIIKKLLIKKKLRITNIRTTFWIYHRLENINSWLFDIYAQNKKYSLSSKYDITSFDNISTFRILPINIKQYSNGKTPLHSTSYPFCRAVCYDKCPTQNILTIIT